MSENERLNALAGYYYAVAQDLRVNAGEQIRIADQLCTQADYLSEQAIKAANAEKTRREEDKS